MRSNIRDGFYMYNLKSIKLTEEEIEGAVKKKDYETVLRATIPLLKKLCLSYCKKYEMLLEFDDRFQLASEALWYSIENYNPDNECKFISYASTNITSIIKKEVDKLNRKKRKPNQPLVSMDAPIKENCSDSSFYRDTLTSDIYNVEKKVMYKESFKELKERVSKVRGEKKKEVLTLALVDGFEQPYIVKKLGTSRQYVNAVVNDFLRDEINKEDYIYTGY